VHALPTLASLVLPLLLASSSPSARTFPSSASRSSRRGPRALAEVVGRLRGAAVTASLLTPAAALAHGDEVHGEVLARTSLAIETIALAVLAVAGVVYARGVRRLWREAGVGQGIRRSEAAAYAGGIAALAAALAPPLDRASAAYFSAHMAQHQLLLLVAPPLLVAARPHVAGLFALAPGRRGRVAAAFARPGFRRPWRALTAPLSAAVLHAVAIWGWHVPVLWEAALAHPSLHAVQHVTMFGTAILFWWAMVQGRWGRAGYGVAVLYVFATAVHTSALGVMLAYARTVWYPANAGAPGVAGALEDQQLGGLVMWVPSGALLSLFAVALFAAWLGALESRSGRPGAGPTTPPTKPEAEP
jgi:putative membrane protein